jgi:5'-deoxynucleotidase YfbR-like HD superfamily hydrolase
MPVDALALSGAPTMTSPWALKDASCSYPGAFLPQGGGSILRIDDSGYVNRDGDFVEVSLTSEKLSLADARLLADYIRSLTRDTGKVYPSITLFSGESYDFLKPETNRIKIEDVAHGLSNQCRFGGHVVEFYSIAEHCVRASYINPEVEAYDKLMHDSAETVMVDLPTPLKRLLRDYTNLLHRVETNFGSVFQFQHPMSDEVKMADLVMLATEKRDLKPHAKDERWGILEGIAELPDRIEPWSPKEARARFLERYEELTTDRRIHG